MAAAGIFGFMTAVAVGLAAAMLNSPVAGGEAARLVWIGVRQSLHVQVPPFCCSVTGCQDDLPSGGVRLSHSYAFVVAMAATA